MALMNVQPATTLALSGGSRPLPCGQDGKALANAELVSCHGHSTPTRGTGSRSSSATTA